MTFYDEEGNAVTFEIADNGEELDLLKSQLKELETLNKCQADMLLEVKQINKLLTEEKKMLTEQMQVLTEQNQKLTEINQYSGYIFILVLAVLLYRILSSALSSIFGGG